MFSSSRVGGHAFKHPRPDAECAENWFDFDEAHESEPGDGCVLLRSAAIGGAYARRLSGGEGAMAWSAATILS